MNLLKLRKDISKKIESIEDENILILVDSFIEFESEEVYEVSSEQESAIVRGISEIENGDFISDEVQRKETNEWLRK